MFELKRVEISRGQGFREFKVKKKRGQVYEGEGVRIDGRDNESASI